jgi:hypothetical protein
MRITFIAALGVFASFSPPPCQKHNEDFLGGEEVGASESSADDVTSSGSEPTEGTSAGAEESAGETSAESSTSTGDSLDGGTDVETTVVDTGAAESTGASDDGPCGAGEALCGGRCIDVTGDDDNCGMCDHKCHPVMQTCEASRCVPL